MKKKKKPAFMSVRRSWVMNPRTRVKKSKKIYSRKRRKKRIRPESETA